MTNGSATNGGSAEARLRLFVAVELPDPWLQALYDAQSKLAGAGLPRLRLARAEGLHLTLKFLGGTPASQLADLKHAISEVVTSPLRIPISLGEPGFFASGRRVRVVWVGLGGDVDALSQLARRIDEACARLGFVPEPRPFTPHLTLARIPEGTTLERAALEPVLAKLRPSAPGFEVTQISLMQSHLGPRGARYERLGRWPA